MFSLSDLPQLVLSLMAVLLALTIHEFAHAYAADKLGDPTARALGRLSLNPLKHLDPIGALFMVLFKFGWAKPVPINSRHFKKPKRDFAITALAGPLANIISAFILTFLFLLLSKTLPFTAGTFAGTMLYNTCLFLSIFSSLSIGLGVFNLIPVPPFDGSRIVYAILPDRLYFKVMKYERRIYWGVIAWLFFGTYIYAGLVSVPFIGQNAVLSGIARIFDLSGLIGDAIGLIYTGMIKLWQLIPFLR